MKKYLIGNWKLNPQTEKEALSIWKTTAMMVGKPTSVTTIICPPVIYLAPLSKLKSKILLGVQNISAYTDGAHTGDISAKQVAGYKASFAILGHSEVRHGGESSAVIAQKVKQASSVQLVPILCVGETVRDESHQYLRVVETQLRESLAGVPQSKVAKLIVAYEPVWAIGADATRPPTNAEVHEMVLFIRKVLSDIVGPRVALSVPILYGGSVDSTDAPMLLDGTGIQGFLVGRASLKPKEFIKIYNCLERYEINQNPKKSQR